MQALIGEFPFPPAYGYDPASVERRGTQRADALRALLPASGPRDVLDLACFDGMTARALQLGGDRCTGVDLTTDGADPRAIAAGVTFARMDAMALEFPDASFDLVYSYNAFEHFADPAKVLSEALRVTRPGGHVHLHFGPLYGAAKGMHAYDRIPVPYCQHLFPLEQMNDHLAENGRTPIDPAHCNQWTVRQFRALWRSVSEQAEIVLEKEHTYTAAVDLITRYPSCFRSSTEHFEDLLVNIIHVVFRKR